MRSILVAEITATKITKITYTNPTHLILSGIIWLRFNLTSTSMTNCKRTNIRFASWTNTIAHSSSPNKIGCSGKNNICCVSVLIQTDNMVPLFVILTCPTSIPSIVSLRWWLIANTHNNHSHIGGISFYFLLVIPITWIITSSVSHGCSNPCPFSVSLHSPI